MVQIRCKNNNITRSFAEGSSLLEILQAFQAELHFINPIVSAKVNNVSQGLKFRVYQSRDVEFIDVTDPSGMRVYTRSLCFVLYKACMDVFPESRLYIEHSLARGYYCNFYTIAAQHATDEDVARIRERMQEIIDLDMPFRRCEAPTEEVVRIFRERGHQDKVKLLETGDKVYSDYYTLGDTVDYYYGALLPSAGYLKVWGLERYQDGLLLRVPDFRQPDRLAEKVSQPRTYETFAEYVRWNVIMGLSNVGDVNLAIREGQASELIQVSEALQEKKIVQIAEEIDRRYHQAENLCRIVLITGPSSSGKTTFSKRLGLQLAVNGIRPVTLSIDNYFVDREKTPRDENGDYDFEAVEAIDVELFNQQLLALMRGEEIEIPKFSFEKGKRYYDGEKLKISQNSVLVIEGTHGLTPRLTEFIPREAKFCIYAAPLSGINLDVATRISTTDNRLIRRIVRDYQTRGYSAKDTIARWPSVRRGEDKYIYPNQEEADVMFNSNLIYEMCVLKAKAEPMLLEVAPNTAEYAEARRLIKFLSYFSPLGVESIPPTSILREFMGGSSFIYD